MRRPDKRVGQAQKEEKSQNVYFSTAEPVKRGAVKVTIREAVRFGAEIDAEEIARESEKKVREL